MNPQKIGFVVSGLIFAAAITRVVPAGFKPFLLHPQPGTAKWLFIAAVVGALLSAFVLPKQA